MLNCNKLMLIMLNSNNWSSKRTQSAAKYLNFHKYILFIVYIYSAGFSEKFQCTNSSEIDDYFKGNYFDVIGSNFCYINLTYYLSTRREYEIIYWTGKQVADSLLTLAYALQPMGFIFHTDYWQNSVQWQFFFMQL